ncbi:MAG: ribbon-helix-helix domain-containing protein [Candidatus Woesearchaeota archaeon]
MATEMITLKLEDKFLKAVDDVVEKEGYQNRTEFIRNALREKLDEIKMKKAMLEIAHLKGAARKKISAEEYEKVRRTAFEKLG